MVLLWKTWSFNNKRTVQQRRLQICINSAWSYKSSAIHVCFKIAVMSWKISSITADILYSMYIDEKVHGISFETSYCTRHRSCEYYFNSLKCSPCLLKNSCVLMQDIFTYNYFSFDTMHVIKLHKISFPTSYYSMWYESL